MTIQFYCPKCNNMIAFHNRHIGKRAKCLYCGQLLIIPEKDFENPKLVELKYQRGSPLPGFYRSLFSDTWKIFFSRENIVPLTFVAAIVCFQFFTARLCCFAFLTYIVGWGMLLGLYLNIIYETAYETDTLPEIYLGEGLSFIWNLIRPFLVFIFTMFMVLLPYIVTLSILHSKQNIKDINPLQFQTGWPLLLNIFFFLGLFLFPVAILTTAVGKDFSMLRPDYLIPPIFKAPISYLLIFLLLVAASVLETIAHPRSFSPENSFLSNTLALLLKLSVQAVAIFAMRSIGLFYRHYNCAFKW